MNENLSILMKKEKKSLSMKILLRLINSNLFAKLVRTRVKLELKRD